MTQEVAVTDKTKQAMKVIFGDYRTGAAFLEIHHGKEREVALMSVPERAKCLRTVLESYVVDMAAELQELGDDDTARLQAEARATLVAIRELATWFPETTT